MPHVASGRVRVLISRDGSAVNVARVDKAGKVLAVIWQRDVSDADQPLTSVFEPLTAFELDREREIDAYREAIAARLALRPRAASALFGRCREESRLASRWAALRLAAARFLEALRPRPRKDRA